MRPSIGGQFEGSSFNFTAYVIFNSSMRVLVIASRQPYTQRRHFQDQSEARHSGRHRRKPRQGILLDMPARPAVIFPELFLN
jgi:hypothetical protein